MKSAIVNINDLTDSRELMEKKAPKSITIFIIIILAVITALIIWSSIGEIDEYTSVMGEIRPQESMNAVSVISGGKIKEINYNNGDIVNAGDTLLTIDVESADTQKKMLTKNISELEKKIKYNEQLKKCVENGKNTFSKSEKEIDYYNQYEKYISDLEVSLGQLNDTYNKNENSKNEANLTLQSIRNSIENNQQLINGYNDMITAVENEGTFESSSSMLISYYNNYIQSINTSVSQIEKYRNTYESLKLQINNGITQSQIDEVKSQLDSAENQKQTLKTNFLLEINQKINSLNTEIKTLQETEEKTRLSINNFSSATSEKEIKEQAKLNMLVSVDSTISALKSAKDENEMQLLSVNDTVNNSNIKSEITGQIVYYNEFSKGDTIQSGAQIAKIIPANNELRTVLYIPGSEISNIQVGQQVEYTISSISSTDFGKVRGKITSISADSFVNEANATVYYKAEGTLDSSSLSNLSGEIKNLKSGMNVEAHVISGSKKIIIWFLEQLNFTD